MRCDYSDFLEQYNYTNRSIIQRLSGKSAYVVQNEFKNDTLPFSFQYTTEDYGYTVSTQFGIMCDIEAFLKLSKFSQYFGFIVGSIMLGIASDKGGRKIIILACIWTAGIMSIFQIVGNDYVSYVFFQFFLGLFIGVSNLIFYNVKFN